MNLSRNLCSFHSSSSFKSLSTLSTSFNLKPTSRSFSTLSPSVKPSITANRYQTLPQIHQTSFIFHKMSISSKAAPEPTLFIDGKWSHSSDGASREVIDPFTAKPFTYVDEATSSDALKAISSSRNFFDNSDWSSLTCSDRSKYLLKIADFLQRDREIISKMEVQDTGKTLAEAETDVDDVTAVFRFYAEEGLKGDHERIVKGEGVPENVRSKVVLEPVGVCVLIAPWNYPLLQICWKLAPALVTGNVCIIKPSEVTPLSTIHLVKIMLEAGVPDKALQLLTAAGSRIGDALTESPDVDLVSFTGGLQTGRRIIKACAGTVKRCTVELGGKNPNIVFADCASELDRVADTVLTAVFLHSGQVCSSGTRLIVEDSIADSLISEVVKRAQKIVLGSGMDPKTETGPNVSKEHLEKLEAFLKLGLEEGAILKCGGGRPDPERFPHLKDGYFFLPTVLDRCNRDMRIVKEETFGPILTVERFKDGDEKQAIFLANDTPYGLAGGVQSTDIEKAKRVAKKVRHGTVWINTYGSYTPRAEWGGFGMSGNGRELGEKGLDEYTEAKHIYEETTPAKAGWFKGEGKEHGKPAPSSGLKSKL